MRLSQREVLMNQAVELSKGADCLGRKVGAIIVRDGIIVSTGYNGTMRGAANCSEGGCARCGNTAYPSGTSYEICTCLHAEKNAILNHARIGGPGLLGCSIYVTDIPCLNCCVDLLQVGIHTVYAHERKPLVLPDKNAQSQWDKLLRTFDSILVMKPQTEGRYLTKEYYTWLKELSTK